MPRKISDKFELFKSEYFPLIQNNTMTKAEVSKEMGVSKRTIYRWYDKIETDTEPFDTVLMSSKVDGEDVDVDDFKDKSTTKEQAPKPQKKKKEKDINYNFPRKATFEALDKSYAVMVKAYAERQQWLSEVLEEIGMSAFMLSLQLAKIPPGEWYDKLTEFKDPQAFIEFVNEYLVALFEAKEDASRILELRDENNLLSAQVFYLDEQVKTLTDKMRELYNYLNAATSLLTKEQLQRLILWNAIYQMQNAEVNKIERGYEISSAEEINGREGTE